MSLPLEKKLRKSKAIIHKALKKHGPANTALAWTGGKDSTLLLWMVKQVCDENNYSMPKCMFINEGHVFEEVTEFVKDIKNKWNLDVDEVKNDDVLKQAKKVGDPVRVSKLNSRNRKELEKLDFDGDQFSFEPESYVGNHLMKTVAMNVYLEKMGYKAVITGIRWDEQEARADEKFFSPRKEPKHIRVHPILHFKERDVWDSILNNNVPFNKLYKQGYRSLGAKGTTEKVGDKPAWEQDLENTTEREGRKQDKEKIMERLRALGYM
jgi:phosphoadenosine phosphosulfate reductase